MWDKHEKKNTLEEIDSKALQVDRAKTLLGDLNENVDAVKIKLYNVNNEIETMEKNIKNFADIDELDKKEWIFRSQKEYSRIESLASKKLIDLLAERHVQIIQSQQLELSTIFNDNKLAAVCVKYLFNKLNLKRDSIALYVEEDDDSDEEYKLPFYFTVISITARTTIQEIFEISCKYWKLNQKNFTLTDTDHNDLSLIFNFTIYGYFFKFTESKAQTSVFYLIEKNKKRADLFVSQLNSIKFTEDQHQMPYDIQEKKNLMKLLEDIKGIKIGLQNYEYTETKDPRKTTYCLRFFFFLLNLSILVIILTSILWNTDSEREGIIKNTLKTYLFTAEYYNLTKEELEGYIKNYWFDKNKGSPFEYLKQIGPRRVQLVIAMKMEINKNHFSLFAFAFNSLLQKHKTLLITNSAAPFKGQLEKDKDPILIGNKTVSYHEPESGQSNYEVTGIYGSYNGGRHILDYYDDKEETGSIFTSNFLRNNFNITKLLNTSTRAISLMANYFDFHTNYFISIDQLFELPSNEELFSNTNIDVLFLNYNGLSKYSLLDLLLLLFSLMMLGIFVLSKIFIYYDESWTTILKLIAGDVIYYLFLIGLLFASYLLLLKTPSKNFTELFTTDAFVDLFDYSDDNSTAIKLKTIAIFLVVFRILFFFRLNKNVFFFFQLIKASYKSIILGLLIISCLLLTASLYFMYTFGPNLEDYNRIIKSSIAIISIFFLADEELGPQIYKSETATVLIVSMVTLFLIIYIFLPFVYAIIFENYRNLILKKNFFLEKKILVNELRNNVRRVADYLSRCLSKEMDGSKQENSKVLSSVPQKLKKKKHHK